MVGAAAVAWEVLRPHFCMSPILGGDNISAHSVDTTTGVLTPLASSPFSAENNPQDMVVNTSGSVAFVSNAGSASVSGYLLDSGKGFLTLASVPPFSA